MVSNEWFGPLLLHKRFPVAAGSSAGSSRYHQSDSLGSWLDTNNPFDAVAALLYRPSPRILSLAATLGTELLPPARTVSLHLRTEILFQFMQVLVGGGCGGGAYVCGWGP